MSRRARTASAALVACLGGVLSCGPGATAPDGSRVVDGGASRTCLGPVALGGAGAPCRCATDCLEGWACHEEAAAGVPGGSCQRRCRDDAECAGARCVVFEGETDGFCRPYCDSAGTCPAGRLCSVLGVCTPFCASDAECEAGRCDRWTGRCTTASEPPAGAANHEPCVDERGCRSSLCGSDGFCVSVCSTVRGGCPDGERCVPLSSQSMSSEAGLCAKQCATTSECRGAGEACLPVRGVPGARACQWAP